MGTPRVMFDADELVISKSGHDATNPALAETNKIFDSKWLFGLQVLGSGVWTYPIESSTYRDFTLPSYGFRPALMIRTKARPYYTAAGTTYDYAQSTQRPATSVFTGPGLAYDRSNSVTPHRFINDTTVRIYGGSTDSILEYHWLAMSI